MINITTVSTVDPINNILDRLDLVKESSNGRWRAKCPSHSSDRSRKRTLSVGTTLDTGAVLLHCFAGCSAEEVCNAVGLELRDLFPRDDYIRNHNHRPRIDYRAKCDNARFAAAVVEAGANAIASGEVMSTDNAIIIREAANHLRELLHV